MFNDEQKAALAAPLKADAVKKRKQGDSGFQVSYIEGWHVIAEANRIFGFDGWSRETIYERCVWEGPYTTREGKELQSASYIAKVRVTVGSVVREGMGSGSGMAANPGEAHESALKEAETDAMKRAMVTFGDQFGLTLYDKAQANVERSEGTFRRDPSPRKPDVTKDRHFSNAAEEIRSGQNGTPTQRGKLPTLADDPRGWVGSPAATEFTRKARDDLGGIHTMEAYSAWEKANSAELNAHDDYGAEFPAGKSGLTRKQFMDKILNETYDRIKAQAPNLRAAG